MAWSWRTWRILKIIPLLCSEWKGKDKKTKEWIKIPVLSEVQIVKFTVTQRI